MCTSRFTQEMAMDAVQVQELSKSYGHFVCLRKCNFQVKSGTVFGLLGPNGAGKSTLIRTLLGLLRPTSGTASVCGFDIRTQNADVRRSTSYLPGDPRLFRTMKGHNVLELMAGLHPHGSLQESRDVARRLELDLGRRVMFMSTGMRQKLALSAIVGCQAPVLILDEPTANLDPNVRATVLQLIRERRAAGRTVLLSSHIFGDIDETCDQVAIMRSGEIVAEHTMRSNEKTHVITFTTTAPINIDNLKDLPHVSFVKELGPTEETSSRFEVHCPGEPNLWMSWLQAQNWSDIRIEVAGIRAIYGRHHQLATQTDSQITTQLA